MIGNGNLIWRKSDRGLSLHVGRRGSFLLRVIPDKTYPAMWRIEFPDGRLSDLGNLSRIKDAACGIAVMMLNQQKEGAREAQGDSPVRSAPLAEVFSIQPIPAANQEAPVI
jgi:hypothetical protein